MCMCAQGIKGWSTDFPWLLVGIYILGMATPYDLEMLENWRIHKTEQITGNGGEHTVAGRLITT